MKGILTIFKKELKRFLTDRRMLLTLLMPGVMIFCIYSLMGNFFVDIAGGNVSADTEYIVYMDNQPDEFKIFEATGDYNITVRKDNNLSVEEKQRYVESGEAHLYIRYEEGFYGNMLSYNVSSGTAAPQVEIYYNSSLTESQIMYSYYTARLAATEQMLANKFDINAGGEEYDLAGDSELMMSILNMILPMLLNVLLLTGCMAVSAESMAGEKERGTIATLLVTPVKRSHLALGKVLALACIALIGATSSFLGVILSFPNLIGLELSAVPYGFADYLMIFAIIIMNVLLFTVILTVISTFAKSVKEANGLATPVMIMVMVLSLVSSIIPFSGLSGYFIPILNTVLCLTSVISMSFDIAGFLITLGVNAVIFALGVFALAKMFNSEKIMFNK